MDHVKRSQSGVALEEILLKKQVVTWRGDMTQTAALQGGNGNQTMAYVKVVAVRGP